MEDVDKDTIKNLIKLCKIDCTEDEQESLLKDLKNILAYCEQLEEVDTSQVSPCKHVLEEIVNVTREDAIGEILPREDFLKNVPLKTGGMVRVPPIIK